MYIGVTDALEGHLPYPAPAYDWHDPEEVDPLFIWEATSAKVDGRGMLILCNLSNGFTCVTAMRGPFWRQLEYICDELIARSMLACGFSPDAVMSYASLTGPSSLEEPHGRRAAACVRAACNFLKGLSCDHKALFQEELTRAVNYAPSSCMTRRGKGRATDRMAEDLMECGITDPFAPGAYPTGFFATDTIEFPSLDPDLTVEVEHKRGKDYEEPEPPREPVTRDPALRHCGSCGAETQAIVGDVPWCLDCLGKRQVKSVPNDTYLLMRGADGSPRQYVMRREWSELGTEVLWYAWPVFKEGDPRNDDPEGRTSIGLYQERGESDLDAFRRLYEKVRHLQARPSVSAVRRGRDPMLTLGLRRDNAILVANEVGQGALGTDNKGRHFIIIDNVKYTPDEFFQLLADYDDYDLHWDLRYYTEPFDEDGDEDPGA